MVNSDIPCIILRTGRAEGVDDSLAGESSVKLAPQGGLPPSATVTKGQVRVFVAAARQSSLLHRGRYHTSSCRRSPRLKLLVTRCDCCPVTASLAALRLCAVLHAGWFCPAAVAVPILYHTRQEPHLFGALHQWLTIP